MMQCFCCPLKSSVHFPNFTTFTITMITILLIFQYYKTCKPTRLIKLFWRSSKCQTICQKNETMAYGLGGTRTVHNHSHEWRICTHPFSVEVFSLNNILKYIRSMLWSLDPTRLIPPDVPSRWSVVNLQTNVCQAFMITPPNWQGKQVLFEDHWTSIGLWVRSMIKVCCFIIKPIQTQNAVQTSSS